MSDYDVNDLVNFANQENPNEFKDAFNSVMKDKISDALMVKRDEMAASMFDNESEVTVDDEVDTVEVDDTDVED